MGVIKVGRSFSRKFVLTGFFFGNSSQHGIFLVRNCNLYKITISRDVSEIKISTPF